uniref:Uncharacterized protein n=1 Tax=Neobodo designis TaxID=312471 RepID=A0A7S1W299_NEODS|mmetsp:Transcript_49704/g.153580  ORF Transcript_49704/g.153580 Transcript_49704/m.153580 type:complete len:296 (+) Transcript_49704:32-919(+)
MAAAVAAHPLLARVTAAMERIAPLALADASWDNVGTLIEAPAQPGKTDDTVLVTIDLTPQVLDEAIRHRASVVVAYHPIIFSGLKKLSLNVPTQQTVLRAISHGISVFCPHTSLDAAKGGINDWLIECLGPVTSRRPIDPRMPNGKKPLNDRDVASCVTGYGRVGMLDGFLSLEEALKRVKEGCGVPTVRVALPPQHLANKGADAMIKTVAVCAGSGTGVFRGLPTTPDLLLTGEMSHHDVLAAAQKGSIVMLTEHTNTERGFLRAVLEGALSKELGDGVKVVVSESDADPLVVF